MNADQAPGNGTGPSNVGHKATNPSASGGIGPLVDYNALYKLSDDGALKKLYKWSFGWATRDESPCSAYVLRVLPSQLLRRVKDYSTALPLTNGKGRNLSYNA